MSLFKLGPPSVGSTGSCGVSFVKKKEHLVFEVALFCFYVLSQRSWEEEEGFWALGFKSKTFRLGWS